MTFFTQAIRDGTIDKNLEMSDDELRNAIIARITESNAWEMHKMKHKDASIATIEQEGGFSQIEKSAGKIHEDRPDIKYDSKTKNFSANCCCKEEFIFDIKNDTVESGNARIHMKDMDPYQKNNSKDGYGRDRSEGNGAYNNGPPKGQNPSYNTNSQSGLKYKN